MHSHSYQVFERCARVSSTLSSVLACVRELMFLSIGYPLNRADIAQVEQLFRKSRAVCAAAVEPPALGAVVVARGAE
jgi:hypothetical protein